MALINKPSPTMKKILKVIQDDLIATWLDYSTLSNATIGKRIDRGKDLVRTYIREMNELGLIDRLYNGSQVRRRIYITKKGEEFLEEQL